MKKKKPYTHNFSVVYRVKNVWRYFQVLDCTRSVIGVSRHTAQRRTRRCTRCVFRASASKWTAIKMSHKPLSASWTVCMTRHTGQSAPQQSWSTWAAEKNSADRTVRARHAVTIRSDFLCKSTSMYGIVYYRAIFVK